MLGRISAARKWQRIVGTDARREATRAAREGRAAARLARTREKARELGFDSLTPAERQRLAESLTIGGPS